jgi:hypothetical protein
LGWWRDGEQHPHQGAQKPLEPAQEQAEVVAGSGEHSIDAVTVASFEVIAIHPMLGLHVANDRLDRSAATHLAADRGGDAAHLAADPDAELLGVVMAAIAFVDMDAAGLDPGQRFQLGNDRPQGVPVKGIAVQHLGVQHELPAFRLGGRGCHGHLAAELVRRPGFAFADAFDLGRVQRVDLGSAPPVILETHPHRQGEQVGEAFLEGLVAGDFAGCRGSRGQAEWQKLERAPRPLELVGMRVTPDHECGALGDPPIALP